MVTILLNLRNFKDNIFRDIDTQSEENVKIRPTSQGCNPCLNTVKSFKLAFSVVI